jgi:hypothetical protein
LKFGQRINISVQYVIKALMIERFPAIDEVDLRKNVPRVELLSLKSWICIGHYKNQNNQTARISETNLLECQKNALVHHFAIY